MSLYLKYRPWDFENLVWQSFIKETLQKSIADKKTVWAYLFCWPRWTWKTSTARIFAKTINCEKPNNGNPCLKCSICTDFADEKLIDIIEIDAASHTWVDNIREIIEKAQFQPTKTTYKIYIIDEVHMLSKWAFNALLKILEEPPKHVKFILATTETHKVPETIISRCQRYDFKRISDNDIKNRLEFIAKSENISTDDQALWYIIKNSSGWLRNAISLFEQLIIDGKIDYKIIVDKLEIIDENIIGSFLEKLLSKDATAIDIYEKMIEDGKNIKLFFKELLFYTKNKSLEALKSSQNISWYITILDTLDECYSKTKNSLDENTTFLIGVLKILNWYSPETQNTAKSQTSTVENKATETKVTQKQVTQEVAQNIEHNDIADIFSQEESPIQKVKEKKSTQDSANFDSNVFINTLKENWAKWWLTMALRWSNLSLEWETLTVAVKTKIAKWQMENTENMSLIVKSLQDMWIADPNIQVR